MARWLQGQTGVYLRLLGGYKDSLRPSSGGLMVVHSRVDWMAKCIV